MGHGSDEERPAARQQDELVNWQKVPDEEIADYVFARWRPLLFLTTELSMCQGAYQGGRIRLLGRYDLLARFGFPSLTCNKEAARRRLDEVSEQFDWTKEIAEIAIPLTTRTRIIPGSASWVRTPRVGSMNTKNTAMTISQHRFRGDPPPAIARYQDIRRSRNCAKAIYSH